MNVLEFQYILLLWIFHLSIWSTQPLRNELRLIQRRKKNRAEKLRGRRIKPPLPPKKGTFKSQTSAFHHRNHQRFSLNFCINACVWVTLIYSNLATLPVARQTFKQREIRGIINLTMIIRPRQVCTLLILTHIDIKPLSQTHILSVCFSHSRTHCSPSLPLCLALSWSTCKSVNPLMCLFIFIEIKWSSHWQQTGKHTNAPHTFQPCL